MNDKINSKINVLPPFKRLCMTIGELPASYLETMTYYETMLWLIKYLEETVIPTINNNAEAVIELQELFVKLQKYVNDYFDNLDVQEEINNKLDDMAEEGTLQEIIADYLNSRAIFGYVNVSEMKSASNLVVGSYAKTLGFYEMNDGGSALYKIIEDTEEVESDEMLFIELDNGLIAQLVINNILNIKSLGAKGDGITNDNLVFNTAIDTGYDIYMPIGTYLIENIRLKTRQKLIGENMTKTIVKSIDNSLNNAIITLGYENGIYNVLSNFSVNGNKNNQTNDIDGISLNNTSDSHHYIQMIQVYDCSGNGIYAYGQKELRIENCVVRGCKKHGIYLNSSSDNSLMSTTVYSCLLNGFRINAGMNRITDCKAFSNGRVTEIANNTPYEERYAGFYDSRGNNYLNCDAQGNFGHGFEFKNTNNLSCIGVRTNLNGIQVDDNNQIIAFTEDPFYDGIHLDHCRYSNIDTTALSMYSDNRKSQRYALCIVNDSGDSDYLKANISHTAQLSGAINELPASLVHYNIINNGVVRNPITNVNYTLNTVGGFEEDNYLPLSIKRSGNVITLRGIVHNTSALQSSETYRILTLTSNTTYYTDHTIPVQATIRSHQIGVPEGLAYAIINTKGQLQLKVPSISNGQYVDLSATWII